jgi:hypothetical protein
MEDTLRSLAESSMRQFVELIKVSSSSASPVSGECRDAVKQSKLSWEWYRHSEFY